MSGDLEALAHDFDTLPARIRSEIEPIVEKTALQVKTRMADDFSGSRHFRQVGRTVDYDTYHQGDFFAAEIGTNKVRGGAASLAGIAYFGGANGGGGTVPDPVYIVEDEADTMIRFIAQAAGAVWA